MKGGIGIKGAMGGGGILAEVGAEHLEEGDVRTSPSATPTPPSSPGPARENLSETHRKLSITSMQPSLSGTLFQESDKCYLQPPGLIKSFCKR